MRYLLIILLAPFLFGFVGTNVIDDFNRSNENPLSEAGIWTDGILDATGCQISSNTLTGAGDKDGCFLDDTFSLPQESFGTLTNATSHPTNSSFWLHVCGQNFGTNEADSYRLRVKKIDAGNDQWVVEKYENGGFTNVGSLVTQEIDDGDKVGFEVLSDGSLDGYYDSGGGWGLEIARNDTDWTCTGGRNIGYEPSNTGHNLDDFGGGDNVAASSGGNPFIWLRLGK